METRRETRVHSEDVPGNDDAIRDAAGSIPEKPKRGRLRRGTIPNPEGHTK